LSGIATIRECVVFTKCLTAFIPLEESPHQETAYSLRVLSRY